MEEEYFEAREGRDGRVPEWVKYTAGLTGFLAIMALFVWVTVPAPPPELAPMVRVSSLAHERQLAPRRRLVLVGDVHGMHKEFLEVLKKAEFEEETDQLVLLGDFISKGPDSLAVLEDAIKWGAACVRGNHENRILGAYARLRGIQEPLTYPPHALEAPATFGVEPRPTAAPTAAQAAGSEPSPPSRERALAMQLEPRHLRYLESCPAILKLGQVKSNGGKGVAVHGGLLYNETDLEMQRPEVVFELRSLSPHTSDPSEEGVPWAHEWNRVQKHNGNLQSRLSVFYGHDARRGLQIRKYAKGLDSRCVRGGRLSAMVLTMNKRGKVHSQVVSVGCPEFDVKGARARERGREGGRERGEDEEDEEDEEYEEYAEEYADEQVVL